MVHLGIIPDGNRRWCKKDNITYNFLIEHWLNNMIINNIKSFINFKENYRELTEITNLSLYVSSIDNIYRNDKTHELGFDLIRKLYKLYKSTEEYTKIFNEYEDSELKKICKDIKLNIIGDINLLPQDIQDIINETKNIFMGSKYSINIAIAYDYNKDILSFSEENNNKNYIRNQSNIDLVFRSGGEKDYLVFFQLKQFILNFILLIIFFQILI